MHRIAPSTESYLREYLRPGAPETDVPKRLSFSEPGRDTMADLSVREVLAIAKEATNRNDISKLTEEVVRRWVDITYPQRRAPELTEAASALAGKPTAREGNRRQLYNTVLRGR